MTRLALSNGGGVHVQSGRGSGYYTKRARTNPMAPSKLIVVGVGGGAAGDKSHLV